MSARQICNAALPLKPLIHKTLLPTLIIHVSSVCMCVRPRVGARMCVHARARGKERRGWERADSTRAPNAVDRRLESLSIYVYSVLDNKLMIFLKEFEDFYLRSSCVIHLDQEGSK